VVAITHSHAVNHAPRAVWVVRHAAALAEASELKSQTPATNKLDANLLYIPLLEFSETSLPSQPTPMPWEGCIPFTWLRQHPGHNPFELFVTSFNERLYIVDAMSGT
jgi:hypothetical protein